MSDRATCLRISWGVTCFWAGTSVFELDGEVWSGYWHLMELSDELSRNFASAALECYDLSGLGIDRERALQALAAEYRDNFADLDDDEVKERRWRNCKIAGTVPADFGEQIVFLGGEEKVICGIRHLGMNLEKPFVQVCPNFAFQNLEEAKSIYSNHLRGHFRMFSPLWVQVYNPTGVGSEAGGALTLAARAEQIQAIKHEHALPALRLVDPGNDDYFKWYSESYDDFHSEFPEKRDWIQKNDLDLMQACREDGLLRVAKIDDEIIGIIAAERSPFLGYDGIYFVEILVAKNWRRRGLAKLMQQRFVEETCSDEVVVWGLIDRSNEASIRTAKANGRRVVRGECFLKVRD